MVPPLDLDLDLPIQSLTDALVAVGKATGTRLEAAPSLRREILMVRVRGVAPDELLRKVAQAVDGKWSLRADGSRLLVPDRLAELARLKRTEERDRATWRGSLAELRAALAEGPEEFGPAEAKSLRALRERAKAQRSAAERARNFDRMFLHRTAD